MWISWIGNFGDRVVERFGIISQRKPTDANCIGSFAPENGAGAKDAVGEYPKGSAARSGDVKRTMSASARRKIAAAQKARWAKFRAQQKKAA